MARSHNHSCSLKPINITYSECVSVAVGIQTAKRMHCTIFSSVACPALAHFSTLSHKRHNFQENVTENKMFVLIFSTTFVWNISHSKKKWQRYDKKIYIGLHTKYPIFLSHFIVTWIFLTGIRKVHEFQFSGKSVQWEPVCYTRADGRTDSPYEASRIFSQFCERA